MTEQNAQEELKFIKDIMEGTRQRVRHDAMYFILWGVVVMAGLFGSYYIILTRTYSNMAWLWPVVIGAGWLGTFYLVWRNSKRERVFTFPAKIIASVWFSCGVAMTLLGFLGGFTQSMNHQVLMPVITIVLAIGYFVTGVVTSERLLCYLAIVWWTGSLVTFLWPGLHNYPVYALMILFLQIIPGFILNKKWKKNLITTA